MASTFTLESHSYGGRYIKLTCKQEKDIANNKSPISWTIEAVGGEYNFYASAVTLKIANEEVYASGYTAWDTQKFPAAKGKKEGTTYVDHDSNGKKTINVSMTVMIFDGVYKTCSGSWTLDDIPRKATITEYPEEFYSDGTPPTIKYSNPAGNNATELAICIADNRAYVGYTVYRDLNKTDTEYTFEAEDINKLKNLTTNSLDITFVIRTRIGGETYWSSQPSKFIMVENDDTKPTVNLSVELDNGSLDSKFDNLWIQGKSKAKVKITAEGKYNAKIQNYTTKIVNDVYDSAEFTSKVIGGSGKVTIESTVKDSRGFTNKASKEIDVIPYSKPLVIPFGADNAILCYRSDGNGKRVGDSTSIWIKAKMSYYSVNSLNNCVLQWRRKLSTYTWGGDEDDWTDLELTTNTDEYNALLKDVVFEKTKSYTVQIRAIDDINEYDIKSFDIPTQDVALHLGKGGKNVSIGEYCDYTEEYTFRSAWKAIFDEGFVDGTDTEWIPLNDFTSYRYKCGYVTVRAWCSGEMTLKPNVYTEIGELPKEYCPKFIIPFTYHRRGGLISSLQAAFIDVDGKILVYTPDENSDYFAFTVTYPI